MGISSDPEEFTQFFSVPRVTYADLDYVEAKLGVELPAAYKQFVTAHSEQVVEKACFVSREENDQYPAGANEIAFFVSRFLGPKEVLDAALLTCSEEPPEPGELPDSAFLPIAELETDVDVGPYNLLLLGVASENAGKLYFLAAELGQDQSLPVHQVADFLAPNMAVFLAQLLHFPDHADDEDIWW